jgi:putative transposase
MALSQSALSELLDAFRTGDGVDMIRESVRTVLQELVEFEAATAIGADRYERTEDRVTECNGIRAKLLATKAGDVELRIPKLRKGSFFPSILEPRRIDQALYAVVVEAYVHGVSTRSFDDLVVALGADSGISKSEISRICSQLDKAVGAFRTRPLDHTPFPYVFLDATYLHVRNKPGKGGQVVSMAVVVATGIAADGSREVLGLDVGDSEDEVGRRIDEKTVRTNTEGHLDLLAGSRRLAEEAHPGSPAPHPCRCGQDPVKARSASTAAATGP